MFRKSNSPIDEDPKFVIDTLDKDSYIESLRGELLYLIEKKLTPLALKYQYTSIPLESRIKWKPMILVLGNYSSGKSTLINEFLGCQVQETGQAPTDDGFTVLTNEDRDSDLFDYPEGSVYEERDGHVLMNDEEYPFEMLRKYGENFASHFKLKKIKSKALRNLVIIDTPGMLDAVNEKNRPYDYQGVIGDLAMLSDLVLVLFDPHKAGTVRESHFSIRKTLPEKTFEDRVVFVLNRVDECKNLEDLLRVYGTLCWNLSAMTGRKDMPRILLTYSPSVSNVNWNEVSLRLDTGSSGREYLNLLENQRQELTQLMQEAPRYRLDHLASFVEFHSRRMSSFLQELLVYRRSIRRYLWSWVLSALLFCGIFSGATALFVQSKELWGVNTLQTMALISGGLALTLYLSFHFVFLRWLILWKRRQVVRSIEDKKDFTTAEQQETWHHIKPKLVDYLQNHWERRSSISQLRKELESVEAVYSKGAKGIRSALHRISDKI